MNINPRPIIGALIAAVAVTGTMAAAASASTPQPHETCNDALRTTISMMKPLDGEVTPEEWIGDFNDWLVGYVNSDKVTMDAAQSNLDTSVDVTRRATAKMAHARSAAAHALDVCKAETGRK